MKNKHKKSILITTLALLFTAGVILVTFFLPGDLIHREAKADSGDVKPVPTAYYAGPSEAIVKNASRQLTEEQKISLIYGEWESSISPATESERNLTEYEIVHYKFPVVSDYEQWYTWTAESYKAVDTTFETYAAIFWKCVFTRFDGSETLVYYITEGGTLLDPEKLPEDIQNH